MVMSYKDVLKTFREKELKGEGYHGTTYDYDQLQATMTYELVKWFQQKRGVPDILLNEFVVTYCTTIGWLEDERLKAILQEAIQETGVRPSLPPHVFCKYVRAAVKDFWEEIDK
jgi:hypothetical protein